MSDRGRTLGRGSGARLWAWLWPLMCMLALAGGSSDSPIPFQNTLAPTIENGSELPRDTLTDTLTETLTETFTESLTEAITKTLSERVTESQTQAENGIPPQTDSQTRSPTNNYTGLTCVSVLPPRRGSFYVEHGNGVSVGTVLAFWCREGYQLVGSEQISCMVQAGKPQWTNYLPVCEAIPRPEDRGLRVAVLASVVSGIVILAMSVSFLICCLQERSGRDKSRRDSRGRHRDKRSARRSECWLEREEGDWDAFPPPKIFHLSQRMDPRLAPNSPLYLTGGMTSYENRGYQRSQESLLKAPLPGLYRAETQIYPHVVLQRVPTPTAPSAPVFPHLSTPPSSQVHQPPHMASYPTQGYANTTPPYHNPNAAPAYPTPNAAPVYPNPNPATQRPWQ